MVGGGGSILDTHGSVAVVVEGVGRVWSCLVSVLVALRVADM